MGRVAHQSLSCSDFGLFPDRQKQSGAQWPALEMGHEREPIIKGEGCREDRKSAHMAFSGHNATL